MESVYLNGGFIGVTKEFSYEENTFSAPASLGIYQNNAPNNTDTFTVDTTGISADDTLILMYHIEATGMDPTSPYSSFTVDSVECTIDTFLNALQSGTLYNSVAIARITGITASSVSVAVIHGFTSTKLRSALSVYKISGIAEPLDTEQVSVAATVTSESYTLTAQNGGIIFFAQSLGDENDTSVWSDATELYDQAHQESNAHISGAYYLTNSTSHTETVTYTGAVNGLAGVAVSYRRVVKNSGIWLLQSVYDTLSFFDPEASLSLTRTHSASSTIADDYGTINTVFAATLIFPVSPSDGLIWETGGVGRGAWLGIRDSGTTLRLRGGDGAASKTASDIDTAVLDITDFPKDGFAHTIVWDFNISTGTARIFIDGKLKGSASATGGSFDADEFSGNADGAYITTSSTTVATGESATASNFTEAGNGLRVYENQLVSI
jgi:hypothetical protein